MEQQPPVPFIHGSTTPATKLVVPASSTALPPFASTAAPASAASPVLAATIPPRLCASVRPTIHSLRVATSLSLTVCSNTSGLVVKASRRGGEQRVRGSVRTRSWNAHTEGRKRIPRHVEWLEQ